ncbi:MAG: glucose-1-phosphate adenylyltransferase [Fusobacteriaceae bacterium]|nr:glucose-1-phosphate adenylyltransferase [Fusobacteriaceae bacterium]
METLAIILAGGRGSRLDILSEKRVKPSVPFAGKYRIIDFTLSNCTNSGIYDIGILTQYLPLSLNEHIGTGKPWDLDRRDNRLSLLQPQESNRGSNWYRGTADAVLQNIEFIKRNQPKYTLILSGDHVYKMDYKKVLDFHKANNADCTITAKVVDLEEASRFGILNVDSKKKIIEFEEKPKNPKSNLASMGIYIFNTDVLLDYLQSIVVDDLDFGKHIIPKLIDEKNVYAYEFYDYWKDVGTYDSYLEANLDLIKTVDKIELDMYDSDWKIYTRSQESPAVKFGSKAKVKQALISNGSIVAGEVEKSVLSPGVIIKPGAIVRNSIIFNDTIIEEGAIVEGAIIDKDVYIGKNCRIGVGEDYTPNLKKPDVLNSGLNIIGKRVTIPDGVVIERNCRILSTVKENEFESKHIKSGTSLGEE